MDEIASEDDQQLLRDVDELGLKDRDVERAVGLPAGFLCKARKGERTSAKATLSWAKLRRWLEEKRDPSGRDESSPTRSFPESLATAIERADTFEALGSVVKRIMISLGRGTVERRDGLALCDLAKERRQILRHEQRERAQGELVRSARLLTPEEDELIVKWRREHEAAPLAPTEAAPPPKPPEPGTPTPAAGSQS